MTYKTDRKEEEPTETIKLHHIEFILPTEDTALGLEVIEITTHDREYKFGFGSSVEKVEWQGKIGNLWVNEARAISRLLKSTLRDNLAE